MTFKTKEWIPYKRKAKSLYVGIKDYYGQMIESLRVERNKRDIKRMLKKLKEYNFNIEQEFGEKKEVKEKEKKDWLKKDMEW